MQTYSRDTPPPPELVREYRLRAARLTESAIIIGPDGTSRPMPPGSYVVIRKDGHVVAVAQTQFEFIAEDPVPTLDLSIAEPSTPERGLQSGPPFFNEDPIEQPDFSPLKQAWYRYCFFVAKLADVIAGDGHPVDQRRLRLSMLSLSDVDIRRNFREIESGPWQTVVRHYEQVLRSARNWIPSVNNP